MNQIFEQMRQAQPQFFSNAELRISAGMRNQIDELISAIESVIALPAFQSWALARAPEIARCPAKAQGVFYGYDFHLTENGPRLIEINTNAGGGLLNVYLLAGRGRAEEGECLRQEFVTMFREEWRLERGDAPLKRIAIVDEKPGEQFLAPEFELFRQLFAANGIDAVVADPSDFTRLGNQLMHEGKPVDMIYNRLTDFSLDVTVNAEIRSVFEAGGVVLTPHPRAHALYADKRNLMQLSDEAALLEMGVPDATRQILLKGIPRTVMVQPEDGERFWSERKRWFFKPPAGFGSRAAYRGDKLTKRVFEEILHGGYIAQEVVPPSEHQVVVQEQVQLMKADIRAYVYQAHVQLLAARLYQGQTTNFRTPGGGFAPVFVD
ncbi:MAG: hypothetical protein IPJ38_11325 [Dechloromonas sp.]|uniref:Circularly permuted type 2 ATP-grasp protein n=1 Tax=Candidatus Dechloromonas phosphorivorans TaxID=2899244 RepID=A0A935JYK8_9RHOO|nr:hypothetical protein [Candidatus Dechloromonas phosphorivorans]